MEVGYVSAPRLRSQSGQILQGDIFESVPFITATAEGATTDASPAILLTPTCDFALRTDNDTRQLCAIEILEDGNPLLEKFQQGVTPNYVMPLPPFAPLFPQGGAVHLRRVSPIHRTQLDVCPRIATLNAHGLRVLLACHGHYHTRLEVNPVTITLMPIDPRVLWEAIDEAKAAEKLADRIPLIEHGIKIAVGAICQHHGLKHPSLAGRRLYLEKLAETDILPLESRSAIVALDEAERQVTELYAVKRDKLKGRRDDMDKSLAQLEQIADLLQECLPHQASKSDLSMVGLPPT